MQNDFKGEVVAQSEQVVGELKVEDAKREPTWTISQNNMARVFFQIDEKLGFNICVSTLLKRLFARKLKPETYAECLQLASFAQKNPKAVSVAAYLQTPDGIIGQIDKGSFSPIAGKAKLQDVSPEFIPEEEEIARLLFSDENPILPPNALEELLKSAEGLEGKNLDKFTQGHASEQIVKLLMHPDNASRMQKLANRIGEKIRAREIVLPKDILQTASTRCVVRECGEEAGVREEDVVRMRLISRDEMNDRLKGKKGLSKVNAVEIDQNSRLEGYVMEITTSRDKLAAEPGKILAFIPFAAFAQLQIEVTDEKKGFFAITGMPAEVLSGNNAEFPVRTTHLLKAGFGLGLFLSAMLILEQKALAASAAAVVPQEAAPPAPVAPVGFGTMFSSGNGEREQQQPQKQEQSAAVVLGNN